MGTRMFFTSLWNSQLTALFLASFFSCSAFAEEIKSLSLPIVVQFSNAAPTTPEFVSDLSREVGVTLSYSQATPEGSHVFLVGGLFADFPLSQVLQRLQRRSDVISVVEEIAGGGSNLAQVVIKFSSAVADPSHPAFVSALSMDVGVTLAYLFEKTRGVQVFRVNGLSQPTQLPVILQRLKKRKDVLSAETNR